MTKVAINRINISKRSHDMNDKRSSYETPQTQVIVVKTDTSILQDSPLQGNIDAKREDYGSAIVSKW